MLLWKFFDFLIILYLVPSSNSSIFRNYAFFKIVFPLNFFHVNHEIDKFGSQLDRKSKTFFFFTFFNVYISWIERDKILISQLLPPKFRCFANQNRPKGEPHENEFWQFSNTKMNIADSQCSKSGWKNGVICLVPFFLSWVDP